MTISALWPTTTAQGIQALQQASCIQPKSIACAAHGKVSQTAYNPAHTPLVSRGLCTHVHGQVVQHAALAADMCQPLTRSTCRRKATHRNITMIGVFGVLFIFLIIMTATHSGSDTEGVEHLEGEPSHSHSEASSPAPTHQATAASPHPPPSSSPSASQVQSLSPSPPQPPALDPSAAPSPSPASSPVPAPIPAAPTPSPMPLTRSKRARLLAFIAAAKKLTQRSTYQQACPASTRKDNVLACVVVNSVGLNGTAQPYLYVLPANNASTPDAADACSAAVTLDPTTQAKLQPASFHSQQDWDAVIGVFSDAIKTATYRQALYYVQDRLTRFDTIYDPTPNITMASSASADQINSAAFNTLLNNVMNDSNTNIQEVLNAPVPFNMWMPLTLKHTNMTVLAASGNTSAQSQWHWQWTDGSSVDWGVFTDSAAWQPDTYFHLPADAASLAQQLQLPSVLYSSDAHAWQAKLPSANTSLRGYYWACRASL